MSSSLFPTDKDSHRWTLREIFNAILYLARILGAITALLSMICIPLAVTHTGLLAIAPMALSGIFNALMATVIAQKRKEKNGSISLPDNSTKIWSAVADALKKVNRLVWFLMDFILMGLMIGAFVSMIQSFHKLRWMSSRNVFWAYAMPLVGINLLVHLLWVIQGIVAWLPPLRVVIYTSSCPPQHVCAQCGEGRIGIDNNRVDDEDATDEHTRLIAAHDEEQI